MSTSTAMEADRRRKLKRQGAVFVLLLAALLWSYWPNLSTMARTWAHDPQYSHGYLVPLFALAFLWLRREQFPEGGVAPSAWGLGLLGLGLSMWLVSALYYVEWFEFLSFIPCVAGLVVLCGGRRALRWSWPAVLFLGFMVPLPHTLETAMRMPLRRLGTVVATYAIQTIGLPAFAEGNVIVMDTARVGVAEACSGLRMLVVFFALATAIAMLSRRPLWERLLIVASAAPIALIANVIRITVTGILHETVGSEIANLVFHDLGGWLMMPLGLALMWLELWFLSRLIVVEQEVPLGPIGGLSAGLRPVAQAAAVPGGSPGSRVRA